jgi:hypothetical protein
MPQVGDAVMHIFDRNRELRSIPGGSVVNRSLCGLSLPREAGNAVSRQMYRGEKAYVFDGARLPMCRKCVSMVDAPLN